MQVRSIAPSLRTPKAPVIAPKATAPAASARPATAPASDFSFRRALGHFFAGFKAAQRLGRIVGRLVAAGECAPKWVVQW